MNTRVGAYIIRLKHGVCELLIFSHRDFPEVPLQIPGGGVDEGETLEEALWREIEEESGLTRLNLLRYVGNYQTYWKDIDEDVTRHFFLVEAPPETPDEWQYMVQGSGIDSGTVFSYTWRCVHGSLQLAGNLGHFLTPEDIPELFEHTGSTT
jgi:ADP-ribose pyrophosphatase YjhB (NUDIX family)